MLIAHNKLLINCVEPYLQKRGPSSVVSSPDPPHVDWFFCNVIGGEKFLSRKRSILMIEARGDWLDVTRASPLVGGV